MTLDFSTFILYIDDKIPTAEILKPVFDQSNDNFSLNDTHYLITKTTIEEEYFWLYAKYGSSTPYSSTVFNTQSKKEEGNPRAIIEVETHRQLFGLYSVANQTLYLSNKKKKIFFQKYLESKLNRDVSIKAFFKDVDEFIDQIKSVEKVKFVAKRNLFSSKGEIMRIFPSPEDVYGLGMPEEFSLEATFKNQRPTDVFKRQLKKMVQWKDSYEADSLLCVGLDDQNFETIFNADSFIQKISMAAVKDSQGMYDPEEIKRGLISKIVDTEE